MCFVSMKIGFDLDKIFVDYPPLIPDSLIDRLYKKKANGVLLYRIPSRPEQLLRQFSHYHIFRPPIRSNIKFLRSIPKDKHQLYLISSRFGFLEKQTLSLLHKLGLDQVFDRMYFNFENKQPHEFKNEVLKKLNLDLYVDDDLPLLQYITKNNKHTKFFWLHPEKTRISLPKGITHIQSLSEILPQ